MKPIVCVLLVVFILAMECQARPAIGGEKFSNRAGLVAQKVAKCFGGGAGGGTFTITITRGDGSGSGGGNGGNGAGGGNAGNGGAGDGGAGNGGTTTAASK